MGWLILCVSGAWICGQALFWMFLEGVFSWDLYLNQWPSSKAFHNVGGPHFISWRHEQHKRLTSCSKKEMCHQPAPGPELQHWLSPESPACWPTLRILDFYLMVMLSQFLRSLYIHIYIPFLWRILTNLVFIFISLPMCFLVPFRFRILWVEQ